VDQQLQSQEDDFKRELEELSQKEEIVQETQAQELIA
jgi:hypothetical protein